MNEPIKINITGIKPDTLDVLQSKYNNTNITYDDESHSMQLQIPKSLHNDFLIHKLDEILSSFNILDSYELIPSWFFEETNSVIKGPVKNFILTSREVLFLKMLITNDKITTYAQMIEVLWKNNEEVTQNAMRQFTKNLNKKLPPKILRNFQNIGYKLIY